jgi:hypothetical protein
MTTMLLMHVLNGIVAAGVVMAGVVLWRTAAIRRARWIVAGLTAYGAAAFLHAMLTGITLGAALSGHGLFHTLPYLLQGAFLGGFVVLPLGWMASIARAGIPRFREGSLRRSVYQAVALTTCVAVLFTSFPREGSRSDSGGVNSQSPAARLAQLDRSLRAIEDGERESPRDRWDPDYVVKMLGHDPQKLFDWVRDNTYWIPYRGALRGPIGVLMDRQGNSLDRALLLATLIEKTGQPVRLAHGEMTRQQALDLLPGLLAAQTPSSIAPNGTEAEPEPDIQAVAAKYQLDGAASDGTLKAREEALARFSSQMDSRTADQTERLLGAVERPDAVDDWVNRLESALGALRDHWWVQRREGQNWVDLDLLNQAGMTGAARMAAKEAMAVKDLAAELHHEIAIRVIAEQWSKGTLSQRKVLEHVLRPAEMIGRPIVLQFWPTEWLADSTPGTRPIGDVHAAVLDQHEWAAVLLVGREVVASTILVGSGDDADAPVKGGDMGGLGSALANSLANRRADTPKQTLLSAVWLEYEIRVPGEKPRTVRRTVFDLPGLAARAATPSAALALDQAQSLTRGLAMMMRTEILPVVCRIAPEFVTHLAAQSFTANKDLLRSVVGGEFSPKSAKTAQQVGNAAPTITPLLSLAVSRLESGVSADHVFVDRPNILTSHRSIVVTGNDIAVQDAMDIVANEVGVDLAVPDAFAIRLEQGVLDTNSEALLGPATGNVGEAFAVSRDWLTVTPDQRSALDSLEFSADIRRRIVQDLESGYIVVAPKAPVHWQTESFAGWWRIDPLTGDALGVAGNGWGQSLTERAALSRLAVTMVRSFLFEYGLCQSFPQAVNSLRVINEELFGGFHPSWTAPGPKSVDPLELADANQRMCLIQAITAGFIATLPLLIMTLRFSRQGRLMGFWGRLMRDNRGGIRIPPRVVKGMPKKGGPSKPPGPPRPPIRPRATQPAKTHYDPKNPPLEPEPPTLARPQNIDQARQNLAKAKAAYDKASKDVIDSINEIGSENELEKFGKTWDPKTGKVKYGPPDKDLYDALQHELDEREAVQERAGAEYDKALKDLKDLQDQQAKARGEAGKGGFK